MALTIKRRLFFSNYLMILLPVILTALMQFVIYFAFVRLTGIDPIPARQGGFHAAEASAVAQVIPIHIPVITFVSLLLVVLLTNYFLTRFITRSIISSIDTLVSGVHEISDGNLTYRIQYEKNDEFTAVCAEFNEMASRLSDMVQQRQLDERNRKELIAGISHDLRTPLTSIKAYIEGLKNGVATTPEMQAKYLDTIQQKTDNIEYIIRQLFLFSKMDIGEFPFTLELIDVGEELKKIVCGLRDEYRERGLRLQLGSVAQGGLVSVDPVQFRNVIQNILDNSVKYTDKDDAWAEIQWEQVGQQAVIRIQDNGPGVTGDKLGEVFDVFFRGDASRNNPSQGSGLGLAISAKIIERLHGTIAAENASEGGLRVVITLPLAEGGAV